MRQKYKTIHTWAIYATLPSLHRQEETDLAARRIESTNSCILLNVTGLIQARQWNAHVQYKSKAHNFSFNVLSENVNLLWQVGYFIISANNIDISLQTVAYQYKWSWLKLNITDYSFSLDSLSFIYLINNIIFFSARSLFFSFSEYQWHASHSFTYQCTGNYYDKAHNCVYLFHGHSPPWCT